MDFTLKIKEVVFLFLFGAFAVTQPTQILAGDIIIGEKKLIRHKAWPLTSRPIIEFQLIETEMDNVHSHHIIFNTDQFFFRMTFYGDWKKAKSRGSRNSCLLRNSDNHNVTFSISEFEKNEFLQSLDDEYWEGYKKYLSRRFPKTNVYYEEDGRGKDRELITFNRKYRQIAYIYKSSKNVFTKTREIFVFIKNKLYVLSFSGPSQTFDDQWNQHSFYVSRMRTIDKDFSTSTPEESHSPVLIR
ncbi:hypothetical protein MLD52_05655 [Puniceicoccaceae bacterium K14]|nr:hypothetical protein [Puniceicoccaceae bacterium K14]